MTRQIRIVDGLVCDMVEKPPRLVGYLFAFPGHGVFAPGGRINLPLTPQQVTEHNRLLTEAQVKAMESHKRIALYLVRTDEGYRVGPWTDAKRWPVIRYRPGRHNIAGTRIDVWFRAAGLIGGAGVLATAISCTAVALRLVDEAKAGTALEDLQVLSDLRSLAIDQQVFEPDQVAKSVCRCPAQKASCALVIH